MRYTRTFSNMIKRQKLCHRCDTSLRTHVSVLKEDYSLEK